MVSLLLAVIYLSFISLGLPDALLGSAWPVMYPQLGANVSAAGILTAVISAGTVISSLLSDRLTLKFGSGKITAVSVAMTAIALYGFSVSSSFWMLVVFAIPYGLGAGSVDASLNNYVALHYESRHMSWLHCMWGVGAAIGPYIMSYALSGEGSWPAGYQYVAMIQAVIAVLLLLSLPIWKNRGSSSDAAQTKPLSLRQIIAIPGTKEIFVAFFCYCALEQTCGIWASSYLVLQHSIPEQTAAGYASLFYLGITLGRAVNGLLTIRFRDKALIFLGIGITALGLALLILPLGSTAALIGLILIGLGCAPVYPCFIHSTPEHFGADRSQAIIGVQMASAYVGILLMPPLFGLIADYISIGLYPAFLLGILALMAFMYHSLCRKTAAPQ